MADRALANLYGYPILRRQDPFKVNLVWGTMALRYDDLWFLEQYDPCARPQTDVSKNSRREEWGDEAGGVSHRHAHTHTHTHTHTRAKTITDGHRQTATNKQATDRQPQVDSHRQTATATATDRQTDRETTRQTDKEKNKQTDTQTDRQTDRQTDIHTYMLTYIHT